MVSASEAHNRSNVRRDVATSIRDYGEIVASLPAGLRLRLNLATSFDCPFDGRMEEDLVLSRLDALLAHREDVEVGLCDTTGRADPDHVFSLAAKCLARFGSRTRWVFHGHDTYGLGLANVAAAWRAGITGFDAAFGGLGGCPSHRAPQAMWRRRMWPGCSAAWEWKPGWTSTRCCASRRRRQRCPALPQAGGCARRWPTAARRPERPAASDIRVAPARATELCGPCRP
ncbi:hypothetical protein ACFQU7_38870 [Pseudoroseomonas wenyumeiae]